MNRRLTLLVATIAAACNTKPTAAPQVAKNTQQAEPDAGVKSDTFTFVTTPQDGPGPVSADAVVVEVLRAEGRGDTVTVSNVRMKGDSAWATVPKGTGSAKYTLVRKNGRWQVASVVDSSR